MPEHQQIQKSKKTNTIFQKKATPVVQTPVSNPYSIIQRARINPKSLTHADIMQLQRTIGNRAVGRLLSGIGNTSTAQQVTVQRQEISEEETCPSCIQKKEIPEEEEPPQGKMIQTIQRQEIPEEEEPLQGKMIDPIQRQEIPEAEEPLQGKMIEPLQLQEIPEEEEPLQGKFTKTVQRQEIPEEEETLQGKFTGTVQRQEIPEEEESPQTKRENNTGMPDNLKAGMESLSGIDMSDVRVQYNSSKPAEIEALAYTQGTDIHVAPGQEKHLPHEAWHVVQQAQGRVRPTMQLKDGVQVNDDEGLEHEADVMGAKAMQTICAEEVGSKKIKEREGTVKEVSQGDTVQMAGHAGVMVFSPRGKLFKRVEINEAQQFMRIMNEQNSEDPVKKAAALGAFPKIYRVEEHYTGFARELLNDGYNPAGKLEKKWVKKHALWDSYVEMESLGGPGIDVLDFKIGTATAHYEDLVENYHMLPKSAREKVARMGKVDAITETRKFGLRDSDESGVLKAFLRSLKGNFKSTYMPVKTYSTPDILTSWKRNLESTLNAVDARLKQDAKTLGQGGKPYPDDARVFKDLNNIHKYLENSNTVYIASSLIMKWTKDRTKRQQEDRIVLIDLAHPIPSKMKGFENIKRGMLLGIRNLYAMLEGEGRRTQ